MRTFDISTTVADEAVHLTLKGELDYTTADELVDEATAHLGRPGLRALRLDCGGITWCDSSGLAAILNLHRACAAQGVALRLENRAQHLDRVLQLTGTFEHLTEPEVD
ncbi:STAS domain-containing protein [Actinokineospora guangxiensis]|uniref:Anti-sigma factor antagonist n=1 Tax=Actinokineospora guangxiensis TaxID=1490288 RepID=A0ABW0EJL4_9PSEU